MKPLLAYVIAGCALGQNVEPAVVWDSMRPVVWGDWAASGNPLRPQQWALNAVGELPPTTRPPGIIAIVDSGVADWHGDIPVDGMGLWLVIGTEPRDDIGHGTHVCGSAIALTNNGLGMMGQVGEHPFRGLGPVLSIKVLMHGLGTVRGVAGGIIMASIAGADVANVSLQGPGGPEMREAAEWAEAAGTIVVFAAGNAYHGPVSGLASDPYWIVVSSIDENLISSAFSSVGERVDFCAPGGQVLSCFPFAGRYSETRVTDYVKFDGTSMAAPHVSGTILRMRAERSLTRDQAYTALRYTAMDLGEPGHDPLYGWGLIQAPAALHLVRHNRADINEDGELDIFDIAAYQALFEAGDYRADFNFDDELTEIDYITFLKEHG